MITYVITYVMITYVLIMSLRRFLSRDGGGRHLGPSMKSNEARGWDVFSSKIPKFTAKCVAQSLTSLHNTVIRKGNWPKT